MAIIYDGPIVAGTEEADTLYGIAGDDTLRGLGGDDTLFGDTDGYATGNDTLSGGFGNDTIFLVGGADTAFGESGNDLFVLNNASAVVDGGEDSNSLRIVQMNATHTVSFSNIQTLKISGLAYLSAQQIASVSTLVATYDGWITATSGGTFDFSNIQNEGNGASLGFTGSVTESNTIIGAGAMDSVSGGDFDDVIDMRAAFRASLDSVISGGVGADVIWGSATGTSYILGGVGEDTIWGGDRGDVIYGDTFYFEDTGNDTIYGNGGNDSIVDVKGNNSLYGGSGDDRISTYFGNDKIFGDDGNDYLSAGLGNSTLDGGSGSDVLTAGIGVCDLTGGYGQDYLELGYLSGQLGDGVVDTVHFLSLQDSNSQSGQDQVMNFETGLDKIDVTGLNFTGITSGTPTFGQLKLSLNSITGFTEVRDIYGSGFGFDVDGEGALVNLTNADFIGLVPAGQTLNGTVGNNVLTGGTGNDLINGLEGADQLFGNAGSDTLDGGAGIDQLTGGLGADVFKFSALTDSVHTTGQMDRIADFVVGLDKIDLTGLGFTGITAGTSSAGLLKVSYNSYYNHTYVRDLNGTGFGFYLTGNHTSLSNSDFIGLVLAGQTLNGTAGNNILQGSNGDDVINGLGGADQLLGNGGNDTLNGGAGIDQLTGGLGSDVFKFGTLTDSVFTNGQMDRIADFVIGTDKIDLTGLGFTGVTTGTPSAGQLKVSYNSYYNHTYVRDLTGGTGFGFYLTGNHTALTNGDFIGLAGSVNNLISAMASFAPAAAAGNSKIEDLQRHQLYNDLANGG